MYIIKSLELKNAPLIKFDDIITAFNYALSMSAFQLFFKQSHKDAVLLAYKENY